MKKTIYFSLLFLVLSNTLLAQSVDDPFSQKKMRKDLEVFKKIRSAANSGLYKYRSQQEIDSVYKWADEQICQSSTFGDFYNIICQLTDFEGSLHNDTGMPKKINQSLKDEETGYFPYPIKWIDGKWIINYENEEIPLGSEIISINNENIESIVENVYKYYTTDGVNTTGKRIGIDYIFSRYYRLNYGLHDKFVVKYKENGTPKMNQVTLQSIGCKNYYSNVNNRYSKPFDEAYHQDWDDDQIYSYKPIDDSTGILTINTFAIGNNAEDEKHKTYLRFLDSTFSSIKANNVKHLIIDVRNNGGGTDPNDLVTYSYLTDHNFSENKEAWISFKKVPYLKYYETKVPKFLRFFGAISYNKWFKKEFYIEKENGFYQGPKSEDHSIREPRKNAFKGEVYLLISPRIASAGSMFAAMTASNKNTTVIGEETMGGYYGHNGHTPLTYVLPKSKISTSFSIVNLEQYVSKKANQIQNRGIIPDYRVTQSFENYLNNEDPQMSFVLELIKNKN